MNDHTFPVTFGGAYDQNATDRRKLQNRIAQRKHREKLRAHRQNLTSGEHGEALIWSGYPKNADQNEISFHAPNDTQQGMNILGSTNGYHGQLPFLQESTNEPGLSSPGIQSQGSTNSSRQGSQEIQYHNDQSPILNLTRNDMIIGTDSRIIKNQNNSKQLCQESVTRLSGCLTNQNSVKRQPTSLVQSQRKRICDQAEKHLDKALSLYDFGVSLDIMFADPCLRDLLVHASQRFRDRRLFDASDEFS